MQTAFLGKWAAACWVGNIFNNEPHFTVRALSFLLPENVDALMKISIEGPVIPDVRVGTESEATALNLLIDGAMSEWNKLPYRGEDAKVDN